VVGFWLRWDGKLGLDICFHVDNKWSLVKGVLKDDYIN